MKIMIAGILLFLAGCVATPYGNYLDQGSTHTVVLRDVLARLQGLYPPAKTTFLLAHRIQSSDEFGNQLIGRLRESGYGIQLLSTEPQAQSVPLGYTLDQIDALYRVTLHVANQRLSRLYQLDSGEVTPSGAWSLSEE